MTFHLPIFHVQYVWDGMYVKWWGLLVIGPGKTMWGYKILSLWLVDFIKSHFTREKKSQCVLIFDKERKSGWHKIKTISRYFVKYIVLQNVYLWAWTWFISLSINGSFPFFAPVVRLDRVNWQNMRLVKKGNRN